MRTNTVALLLLVAGCSPKSANPLDERFADRMKTVAATVQTIPQVEQACLAAHAMCAPAAPKSSRVRSAASTAATGEHARKIYSLRASDPAQLRAETAPIGLVVVKAAFAPVAIGDVTEARNDAAAALASTFGGGPCDSAPWIVIDGKQYRAGDPAGLFVMEKLDPATPGTDAGWIYGTILPDGTVTAAGNIASCATCHASAKHDRLFSPET